MRGYHQGAYTLDPNQEIPEDAAPSASHDEEAAEQTRELAAEHKEAVQADVEAENERVAEFGSREQLPKPSELLQERGYEPAPADEADKEDATTGQDVPEGTVQEVLDWAGDDQTRIQSALNAERAGQNRSSLISELEKRQAAGEEEEQA